MRHLALAFATAFTLCGCFGGPLSERRVARYYEPTTKQGILVNKFAGDGCNEPYASVNFPLANGLFVRLRDQSSSDSVEFAVNVYLFNKSAKAFRFRSASVAMKSPEQAHIAESPLGEFVLDMYRLPRRTFSPVAILEAPNDIPIPNSPGYVVPQFSYGSIFRFANIKPRQIVISLPAAEVDGKLVEFPSVEFLLVERDWVFSCLK